MAFFPTGGPPPPSQPPPPPRGPRDDEAWRDEAGRGHRGPGRPNLSTTQIIIGLLVLLVAVSFASYLLVRSATPGFEAVIVSPEDGATLEPGQIVVRIRTNQSTSWSVQTTRPEAPDQWEEIASGSGAVAPGAMAAGGRGTHFIPSAEPGEYRFRLVAQNSDGEEIVETAVVTVAN